MAEDNKERLLAAAIQLFAEYGYERVSIRQIAAQAQVNSAMISYYFGSKQQLYDAALVKQVAALRGFVQADTDSMEPREVLCRYAETMRQIHHQNPLMMKYICREFITPSEHVDVLIKEIAPRLFAALGDALRRGIRQGIFREDIDIRSAVILWIGMVNFFYISHNLHERVACEHDDGRREDRYLEQAVATFLAGIERRDRQ